MQKYVLCSTNRSVLGPTSLRPFWPGAPGVWRHRNREARQLFQLFARCHLEVSGRSSVDVDHGLMDVFCRSQGVVLARHVWPRLFFSESSFLLWQLMLRDGRPMAPKRAQPEAAF